MGTYTALNDQYSQCISFIKKGRRDNFFKKFIAVLYHCKAVAYSSLFGVMLIVLQVKVLHN